MSGDNNNNNFKSILYNNSQKNKSAFIEKVIAESSNLCKLNQNGDKSAKKTGSFLDEEQLKQLAAIFSNIPLDTIRQTNERFQLENYRNKSGLNGWQKRPQPPQTARRLNTTERVKTSRTLNALKSHGHEAALAASRALSSDKKRSGMNSSMTTLSTDTNGTASNLSMSSQIVIHVCDEAKRLKQDFMCPRDLLVKEMKYFSYNLNINVSNSTSGSGSGGAHAHSTVPASALSKKNLDEIDISVHCDINIFDWLMRYVKRNHPFLIEKTIASPANNGLDSNNNNNNCEIKMVNGIIKSYEPKLEVNNCVSILLSSDFLIMGELVDKCIVFIAENLEAVLQIQCVLNGKFYHTNLLSS